MSSIPDSFCIAPWIATYVDPRGDVSPCCITDGGVANLKDKSFSEIYKTDMNQLKAAFLNNEKPKLCVNCWKQEQYYPNNESYRQSFNKRYKHYIKNALKNEHNDIIYYWDLRPSNNCNFSCLMCDPSLSSGVWQLRKDLNMNPSGNKFFEVDDISFEESVSIVKTLLTNNRDSAREFHFYFAGGEPLMLEHHRSLLLWLLENDFKTVNLRYNTNCSTLKYKGTNFLDIWEQWETKVVIDASVDSSGKPGEFQRYGSSWAKVKENISKIAQLSNVELTYNLTTGFLTYDNIINTVNELEEIDGDNLQQRLRFTPITRPANHDIRMIPKNKLNTDILDELDARGYESGKLRSIAIDNYDDFENHITQQTPGMNRDKLWEKNFKLFNKIKELKDDDVCDIIPWIQELNYD